MGIPRTMTLTAAMAAAALAAACASGNAATPTGAVALIKDRCVKCHSVERIKKAAFNEAGWADAVGRMRANGAEVSDDEAAEIVRFLADGGGAQL